MPDTVRRIAAVAALAASAPAVAAAAGPPPGAAAGPGDPTLLAAYVLLALVFSFLCSVSEAVLLSVTPSWIEGLAEKRPRLAVRLHRLKVENVDRALAAILTLNTIAHTVGAIGAGAEATAIFGSAYFGLFSGVMTLLILFLSEIVPKTLGAVHWRALAGPVAWFVQALIWLLFPLIVVSETMTRWIGKGRAAHAFSRDELAAMANLGERSGRLGVGESRIIRNLLALDRLTAQDIMTPRPVMESLPEDLTVAEAAARLADLPFSRLPVHRGDPDKVTGFVLKTDVLLAQARGEGEATLRDVRRDLLSVPETIRLRRLLETFLDRSRAHLALVVDEYGGTAGLVTMEDAVETLLGIEILDELDETVDMQALARRRWRVRAREMGLPAEPEPPAAGP